MIDELRCQIRDGRICATNGGLSPQTLSAADCSTSSTPTVAINRASGARLAHPPQEQLVGAQAQRCGRRDRDHE